MQLVIVAVGSRGDVHPYLALGGGLADRGHTVRVATHRLFETRVGEEGLEFAPLEGDPRRLIDTPAVRNWLASGRSPVRAALRLRRLVAAFVDSHFEEVGAALRGAEAVIFSALGIPAYHHAERLGIPAVGAFLQPLTSTRAFPSPFAPRWLRHLGRVGNLAGHLVVEEVFWQALRPLVNRQRTRLGLGPLPRIRPARVVRERLTVVYGFSPAVVPPPADWRSSIHVTGYWFLDPPPSWSPSPSLVGFLESGPPPVYVGFGSRPAEHPGALARVVVEATAPLGCRVILATGWGGLGEVVSSDRVMAVSEVPHRWLLPRTAAVVHHGGAGTTAAGLRAGRPSVVIPSFADQFFWGERVEQLGVGPPPVPLGRLTSSSLASALEAALGDPAMGARASRLGARIRAEEGVRRAADVVESLVGEPGRE